MAYKVLLRNKYREDMISFICPVCKSIFAFTPDEIKVCIDSTVANEPFNAIKCPCCKTRIMV